MRMKHGGEVRDAGIESGGSIFDPALYVPTQGFMGCPNSYDLEGCKLAILGMPFDCGRHPVRIGARQGPFAIREQSALVRPYFPPGLDFNPLTALGVVDCGDAKVMPGRIEPSFEVMEAALREIAGRGVRTLTMGGDGSVTLPQLRALHRIYPDLVVLHLDAHTDTYPGSGQEHHNTATTFTRAAEEGLIDTANSLHIGARRPDLPARRVRAHALARLRADIRGRSDGARHRSNSRPHPCTARRAPGLPVLGHGLLRPLLRAGGLHADLGAGSLRARGSPSSRASRA